MISACRSCGELALQKILSLGQLPLANALLTSEQLPDLEPRFPLEVAFCPNCFLLQIMETVPPEKVFREYLYFSSFSEEVQRHARQLAHHLVNMHELNQASLVVEIASNDGYLLRNYKEKSIPVLGVEPARNIAKVAMEQHGIPTVCEFFGRDLAAQLRREGVLADVIHAHNVLAHVPDLNGFAEGLRLLLKPTGLAVIEVPYVRELIRRCEFDTIYHEHLFYFSLASLVRLFARHGLAIKDVETLAIHGGSLRLFVVPESQSAEGSSVAALLDKEASEGMDRVSFYQDFARRVDQLRVDLRELLSCLKNKKARLAAYGAAAKGSTLLNFCDIGCETLDYVVDRSTYKQGRYMPGVRLPIYSPSKLQEEMPDYLVVLAWNFADEIMTQQAEYHKRGGRFIIPVPVPQVIES